MSKFIALCVILAGAVLILIGPTLTYQYNGLGCPDSENPLKLVRCADSDYLKQYWLVYAGAVFLIAGIILYLLDRKRTNSSCK